MKNLYLLPTDKPSRLRYFCKKLEIMYAIPKKSDITFQNIYITSDEEIKKGDWIYDSYIKKVIICVSELFLIKHTKQYKKIILTTDRELIADGVQAIDYDFLNWFINNSHFTEVEIKEIYNQELNCCKEVCESNDCHSFFECKYVDENDLSKNYKIILPKKETEQIKCYGKFGQELFDGDFVDVQGNGVFQIYKKEDNQLYFKPYGEEEMVYTYFSKDIAKCDEGGNWITNPNIYEYVNEGETLEEENQQSQEIIDRDLAGKKWVFEINGHKWSNNDNTAGDNYGSFIEGAKWQSERSYNQEEVINIFFLGRESLNKALVTKEEALEIIEQFKKK